MTQDTGHRAPRRWALAAGCFVLAAMPVQAGAASRASELSAQAAPAPDAAPKNPAGPFGVRFGGRAFEVLVGTDFLAPADDVAGLELNPYGLGLFVRASYSLPMGVWFGASGRFYPGKAVEQVYHPPLTILEIPMVAKSGAYAIDALVGYDQPLGPVVLRYSLGLGATIMNWDFGAVPYTSLAGFSPMVGSLAGFHLDPRLHLVWSRSFFVAEVSGHFQMDFSPQIPMAGGGSLGLGARF